MIKLFTTSFCQVFLVAVNTAFIARGFVPGIAVASFLISWLWVGNVKKATIATRFDQFVYASGAMCGGLSGYFFAKLWV